MDVRLPLTEAPDAHSPQRVMDLSEADIAAIVDHFYDACRRDALLGPIFEARIHDWPGHLATIRDFWSSALLRTRRYTGRPIEAHEALSLRPEHYARWFSLWNESVRRFATPTDARVIIEAAAAMARAMVDRGYLDRTRLT